MKSDMASDAEPYCTQSDGRGQRDKESPEAEVRRLRGFVSFLEQNALRQAETIDTLQDDLAQHEAALKALLGVLSPHETYLMFGRVVIDARNKADEKALMPEMERASLEAQLRRTEELLKEAYASRAGNGSARASEA